MPAHQKNHCLGENVLLESKCIWYPSLGWRRPKSLLLRYVADPAGPGGWVMYDLVVKASKNPTGFPNQLRYKELLDANRTVNKK